MKSQVTVPAEPQNNNSGDNLNVSIMRYHRKQGTANGTKQGDFSKICISKVRSAAKHVKFLEEKQETKGLLCG